MDKKGQVTPMVMLSTTIVIIIAMVVISIIVSVIDSGTQVTAIADDQFVASNTSCTRVTTNCIRTGTLSDFKNSTGAQAIGAANFSICSIASDEAGIIMDGGDTVTNANYNGVTLNTSYSEISCAFLGTGITVTIINFIPLLAAVVLLVFVASLIKT